MLSDQLPFLPMSDNPYAATTYAAATAAEESAAAGSTPMFYVVAPRKAAILFLGTVGYYGIYWFFKQWDCYKDHQPYASKFGSTIWPVPRALFSIFFYHALFDKIREYGNRHAAVAAWHSTSHAWLMVVLTLLSGCLDRAANKSLGSPTTDLLSLLILLPLLLGMLRAQRMINVSCDDPDGAGNAALTGANYAWIAFGAVIWLLIAVGLLLPS